MNVPSYHDRAFGVPLREDDIQRAVMSHIRSRAARDVFAFHYPAGGYRRPVEAKILKGLGQVAGIPDVLILKRGTLFALELKTDKGKVSPAQEATMNLLRAAGAVVAVTYGLDAALAQLESWGVLKGRRAPA